MNLEINSKFTYHYGKCLVKQVYRLNNTKELLEIRMEGEQQMDDKLLLESQINCLILSLFNSESILLDTSQIGEMLKENEPLWQKVGNKGGKKLYIPTISGGLSRVCKTLGALSLVSKDRKVNLYMVGPKTRYDRVLLATSQNILMGLGLELENLHEIKKNANTGPVYSYLRLEKSILTKKQLYRLAKKYGYTLYQNVGA